MGFAAFAAWFGASLIVLVFLETMIQNPFITSFIIALLIGFLGATRENE